MDFFRHHPTSAQQHGSPAAESLPFPNLPRCVVGHVDQTIGHLVLESKRSNPGGAAARDVLASLTALNDALEAVLHREDFTFDDHVRPPRRAQPPPTTTSLTPPPGPFTQPISGRDLLEKVFSGAMGAAPVSTTSDSVGGQRILGPAVDMSTYPFSK